MSAGSQRAFDYMTVWGMAFTWVWGAAMTLGLARPMNIMNIVLTTYTDSILLR